MRRGLSTFASDKTHGHKHLDDRGLHETFVSSIRCSQHIYHCSELMATVASLVSREIPSKVCKSLGPADAVAGSLYVTSQIAIAVPLGLFAFLTFCLLRTKWSRFYMALVRQRGILLRSYVNTTNTGDNRNQTTDIVEPVVCMDPTIVESHR